MAAATICAIADAVVSELNDPSRTWVGQFQAVRDYAPLFAEGPTQVPLTVFADLQVRVIPRSRPVNELLTRQKFGSANYNRRQQHRIDIVLEQKTPDTTPTSFDPLMALTENVEAFLLNDQHRLTNFAAARMIDSMIDPYPDITYLEMFGIFVAVIQGTFEAYI